MAEEKSKAEQPQTAPAINQTQAPTKKNYTCWIIGCVLLFIFVFIGLLTIFLIYRGVRLNSQQQKQDKAVEQAINENNQKATEPVATNEQLLSYFDSISFKDSQGNPAKPKRWTKNTVSVQLNEAYNQDASNQLDKMIDAFNKISNTMKLSHVASGGDIQIYYESRSELSKTVPDALRDRQTYAWTSYTNLDASCIMHAASIYIQSDVINSPLASNSILVHEMGHAIGFSGHNSGKIGCNMMTEPACGPMETFTQYDTFAIKALYNTSVPVCIDEKTTDAYLLSHWPE